MTVKAAAAERKRREAFLKKKESFRRSAFYIINEMVALSPGHPSMLVDEALHSIFFLGKINNPKYDPDVIINNQKMLDYLKMRYPRPFENFSSQLPKRSPFSCVLDMIVNLTGQERQDQIITKLQELILKLKNEEATDLTSSTICVSQCNQVQNSVRYYGVSMSTSGPNSGRIITAASCLSTWDSYVAGAVMTYYPETEKKTYFDGTIIVPNTVRCEAFNLSLKTPKSPCQSCANLFGFPIFDQKVWPYGNCAEVESLSNLFKNENEVKDQAQPTSETYNAINMQRAEASVRRELENILRMVHFRWDQRFYTPQGA